MPPIREFHVGFHVGREATPGASPFCARVSADRGGLFTPACPAPPPLSAPASPPASTPPAAPRRAGYGQSRPRSHPPPPPASSRPGRPSLWRRSFPLSEPVYRVLDQGHRCVCVAIRDLRALLLPGQGTLDQPVPARIQRLLRPPRGPRLGGYAPRFERIEQPAELED